MQRKKSLPDVAALPAVTVKQGSAAMTREEISVLSSARREEIRRQLEENDISVYKFPDEEDQRGPFAVVGSNVVLEDPVTGKTFRGRKYPWGCVSIEEEVGLTDWSDNL